MKVKCHWVPQAGGGASLALPEAGCSRCDETEVQTVLLQSTGEDFESGHSVQWDEVAEGLGSGRTPAGCLSQYQRCHKGDALLNSKWTPEEATRLAQVIAELGTRDWQVALPRVDSNIMWPWAQY